MTTAIEDGLQKAGMATVGKRLDAEISRILERTNGDLKKASSALWLVLLKDKELARTVMAKVILEAQIKNGMTPKHEIEPETVAFITGIGGNAPPSKERLVAMEKTKNKSAQSIFDRTKLHTGRPVGNVEYHEITSLVEDGELLSALKRQIGHVPPEKRKLMIRELMTPTEFHYVLSSIKAKVN